MYKCITLYTSVYVLVAGFILGSFEARTVFLASGLMTRIGRRHDHFLGASLPSRRVSGIDGKESLEYSSHPQRASGGLMDRLDLELKLLGGWLETSVRQTVANLRKLGSQQGESCGDVHDWIRLQIDIFHSHRPGVCFLLSCMMVAKSDTNLDILPQKPGPRKNKSRLAGSNISKKERCLSFPFDIPG